MSTRFELLALAFCLLPASTWAQVAYNASGPYYTNSNTTAYDSGSAGQTSYTVENIECPSYDGQNITNADDSNYQVLCDSYISSSAVSQRPDPITPQECLTACDGLFGCTGAYISKQGICSLSVGQIFGTIKSEEYTAFLSIGDDVLETATSSEAPPSIIIATGIALTAGTTISLSTHTPPAPFPNITHPSPYVVPNVSYPNPFGQPKSPYASGYGPKPTGYVSPHPPQFNTSVPPPWLVNASGIIGPKPTGIVSPNPPQYNTTNSPPWLVNATYGPNFTWPNTTLPSPSLANITYHPPNITYPNATFPNTTYPSPPVPKPASSNTTTNATCSINNLTCPACSNHTVTDSHNATYAVLCGYSLTSTSRFAFAEPLPAQYCLARCDERNATCVGASWDDQECTLALGTLKTPIPDPDYIAFIRVRAAGVVLPTGTGGLPIAPTGTGVAWHGTGGIPIAPTGTGFTWHATGGIPLPPISTGVVGTTTGSVAIAPISTGLSWLNMSSYGGYAGSNPGPTAPSSLLSSGIPLITAPIAPSSLVISTSANQPGIVTITSTVSPEPTCNPGAISCPACDGLRIVDTANETYRLQCNFKPTCDSLVGFYGLASLNVCMQRCDKDATCLAAVFNQGHCDICQRGIEGEYDEDVDYLVLIPETPEQASVSATLGTATITSSVAVVITSAATTPIATTLSVATPAFSISSAAINTTLGATTLSNATPVSLFPTAPTPTASCNATAPTCPECHGITHTDPNGVEYTLDCDAVCTTQSLWAPRGMISRDTCLSTCDNNPDCVAANYNPFGCGSCKNITYDNITPEASYLVYVRKALAASPSSSTEVEAPAPTGWENSPPIIPSSWLRPFPVAEASRDGAPTPTPTPPPTNSSISCPANDNDSYSSPSGRSYNIACDSVLEADSFSQTSATNFDDCAAACTGECGGVQFSDAKGGCLLLTSISVVASSAGWTAGVAVTWPGTAGPDVVAPTATGKPAVLTTVTIVPLGEEEVAATSTALISSPAAVLASSTPALASSTAPAAPTSEDVAPPSSVTQAPPYATGGIVYGGRPWGGPPGGFYGGPPNGGPQGPPSGWRAGPAGGRGGGGWWGGWGRGRGRVVEV